MVAMRSCIMKRGYTFCNCFWMWPIHIFNHLTGFINMGFFFGFHCHKIVLSNPQCLQEFTMCRNWIFVGPILEQFSVNIAWRRTGFRTKIQVIVMMGVATATHCFNMDHCRAASCKTKFTRCSNACMPSCWVRTIDGPTWKAHRCGFVSPQFHS